MSTATNAAEQLKSFVNKIKPLLEAAEYLESLGSLEQAHGELSARKKKAESDFLESKNRLDALAPQIQEAEGSLDALKLEGEEITKKASVKATDIVSEADLIANSIIREADSKKSGVLKQVAEQNVMLKNLQSSIDVASKELGILRQTIRETKAKISGL